MKYGYKHGMSNSRLYRAWDSMKARCYRKTTAPFKKYGGRGITVCDEWRNSFQAFCEWAMAHGYEDGLSLDRIDVNGNYEPSNCRWVSMKEQENNRSNNVKLEYNGESRTIAEWSEILGIRWDVLYHRVQRGWSTERILATPKRQYKKKGT